MAVKDSTHLPESIDKAKFNVVRKGYDKREVRQYLEELETAFRDLEAWSKRAKVQLAEAEQELAKSRSEADGSVDNAMFAVFDAKDRILEKARRRAEQIEEEALAEAEEIKARADRLSGDGDADDIIAAAREEAQDIIDRARREAQKLGGGDVESLQREMDQKDQQLASMRRKLEDAREGEEAVPEVVVAAQARADQIIREAQEEAERLRSSPTSQGDDEAAAGFGNISDDALLAGMAAELRDVHDQVEQRRRELAEIDAEVEARRIELREAFDAAEAQKAEARHAAERLAAIEADLEGAGAAGDLTSSAEIAAERDQILAAARDEAAQLAVGITREAEDRKRQLEAEVAQLAERLDQDGTASAADDGRIAELESEIAELQTEMTELQASKDKARQQSAAFAEIVDEMKAQVAELEAALAERQAAGDSAEIEARVADLRAQLEAKESELETVRNDLRGEADALAARVADLSTALEAKEAQLVDQSRAQDVVAELEDRIGELTSELEAKDAELESAVVGSREEAEALAARVGELTSELEAKDAEVAAATDELTSRVSALESDLAEATSQLEAKTAEYEAMASALRDEGSALAARVAELTERAEAVASELATVQARASRVEPLSQELTKARAELSAQRADMEKVASLADIARQLRERVGSLEADLATARDEASELAKLRLQVEALEARSSVAESAAARADEELSRIIHDVEEAESEAIRRAAAAEAARIRELTEESLGIAREHTTGTGLDGDDYVAPPSAPIEVSSDPDDWSDIFAAADAIAARLAGDSRVSESSIDAVLGETEAGSEPVISEPAIETVVDEVPADEPSTVDDGVESVGEVSARTADRAAEGEDASGGDPRAILEHHAEADEPGGADDRPEPEPELEHIDEAAAGLPPTERDEWAGGDVPDAAPGADVGGAETSTDDALEEAPQSREILDLPEPPATGTGAAAAIDELSGEAHVPEFMEALEAATPFAQFESEADGATEPVDEPSADDPFVGASEDQTTAEIAESAKDEPSGVMPEADSEEPSGAARIAAETLPVTDEADGELQEDGAGASDLPEPAAAAALPEPDVDSEPTVVDSDHRGTYEESPADDAEPVAAADESGDDDAEVVPMNMAERLRLARAELEAELDPATLPAEAISAPPGSLELVESYEDDDAEEETSYRQPTETRYARQSAKLPRIGESGEETADGVSSMSRFRARMLRGKGKDAD